MGTQVGAYRGERKDAHRITGIDRKSALLTLNFASNLNSVREPGFLQYQDEVKRLGDARCERVCSLASAVVCENSSVLLSSYAVKWTITRLNVERRQL